MTGPATREAGDGARPSAAALFGRALDETRGLMRRELDLARAEADVSLSRAGGALGLLAGALVLALAGLHVLAGAAVGALARAGLDPTLAAALVGAALAALAGALAARGLHRLRQVRLAPDRVARNVRADLRAVTPAQGTGGEG